jgi:hypothetical protein
MNSTLLSTGLITSSISNVKLNASFKFFGLNRLIDFYISSLNPPMKFHTQWYSFFIPI